MIKTDEKRRSGTMTIKRKQGIIEFIEQFRAEHKFSPTVREIAAGIGYSANSFSNIALWVRELKREGWLDQMPVTQRGLILIQPPPRPYYFYPSPVLPELLKLKKEPAKPAKNGGFTKPKKGS